MVAGKKDLATRSFAGGNCKLHAFLFGQASKQVFSKTDPTFATICGLPC